MKIKWKNIFDFVPNFCANINSVAKVAQLLLQLLTFNYWVIWGSRWTLVVNTFFVFQTINDAKTPQIPPGASCFLWILPEPWNGRERRKSGDAGTSLELHQQQSSTDVFPSPRSPIFSSQSTSDGGQVSWWTLAHLRVLTDDKETAKLWNIQGKKSFK